MRTTQMKRRMNFARVAVGTATAVAAALICTAVVMADIPNPFFVLPDGSNLHTPTALDLPVKLPAINFDYSIGSNIRYGNAVDGGANILAVDANTTGFPGYFTLAGGQNNPVLIAGNEYVVQNPFGFPQPPPGTP